MHELDTVGMLLPILSRAPSECLRAGPLLQKPINQIRRKVPFSLEVVAMLAGTYTAAPGGK